VEIVPAIVSALGQGSVGVAALAIAAVVWLFVTNQRLIATQKAEVAALNEKVASILEKIIPLTTLVPPAIEKVRDTAERLERAIIEVRK